MKRYLLNSESGDRWYFYRLTPYLLGFAAAGLGIVMMSSN